MAPRSAVKAESGSADHPGVMPKTRFAIAAYPRTGSERLSEALNAHPSIICRCEVLRPTRAFVDDLFAHDVGHEAVGVTLLHGHAPVLTGDLLRDPSVRKIVLRRESRVRVFLSVKRATRAGKPIEVDPGELRAFCREYGEYLAWLDRHLVRQNVLRLSYERLFDRGELARVLDFLGVRAVAESPLEAGHDRQSSDTLREAISNFAELERRFARTELAAELAAA
jgi:hypothetical protein